MPAHRMAIGLLLLLSFLTSPTHADLRSEYGTTSFEAAKHIRAGMTIQEKGDPGKALKYFNKAIQLDPKCAFAHYWRGSLLTDLGHIDEGLVSMETCIELCKDSGSDLPIHAGIDTGLTLGKLGRYEESNIWLTRAILVDMDNSHQMRWKPYRNMAINHHETGNDLAASVSALLAYQDAPERVSLEMIQTFFKNAEGHEHAEILSLPRIKDTSEPRTTPPSLELAEELQKTESKIGKVVRIVPATDSAVFCLIIKGSTTVSFFDAATGSLKSITIRGRVNCADYAAGYFYLGLGSEPRIEKRTQDGQLVDQYQLTQEPTAIAVFPELKTAYFTAGSTVHGSSLEKTRVFATDVPAQKLAKDLERNLLFCSYKPPETDRNDFLMMGRQPMYGSRMGGMDWHQGAIIKLLVGKDTALTAGFRENAASNSREISLSADGRYVSVAGGGGWRPTVSATQSGYGCAVFRADNLGELEEFYPIEAYSQGVAINHITRQVAVIREQTARLYNLGDNKIYTEVTNHFDGVAAWSGDGRFLLLANKTNGVWCYETEMDAEDVKRSEEWLKRTKVKIPKAPPPAAKPKGHKAFATFSIKHDEKIAQRVVRVALSKGSITRPVNWRHSGIYENAGANEEFDSGLLNAGKRGDYGVLIYKTKSLMKEHPDYAPLKHTLASTYFRSKQYDQAIPLFIEVIREDRGRTILSLGALIQLGQICEKKKEEIGAIYCYAYALYLDKMSSKTRTTLIPLLMRNGFSKEANAIGRGKEAIDKVEGDSGKVTLRMPAPVSGEKMKAEEIFKKIAPSTVLIVADHGKGSGICVADPGYIMTSEHVVRSSGRIDIFPFALQDGKLVKQKRIKGKVVLKDRKRDVALIRLESVPKGMRAVPLAASRPSTGMKVFALGSPGMGDQVLEQSMSEGIISSSSRMVDNQLCLQHTAAVNPGNSGGPLISETGEIVGLVTLKANLENVSFAIPSSRLSDVLRGK